MKNAFDVIVVGAGAAGIAAAATAARAGCATLLIDQRASIGGTGGHSGLTTLCGLYDSNGQALNNGFVREFSGAIQETPPVQMGKVWALPYRPESFRKAAATFLEAVEIRCQTRVEEAFVQSDRIVALNGISAGAVVDCTGDAEVARAIGLKCMATDEATQAPAVIIPLRGVKRDLSSPAAVAQVMLPLARAGFAPLNFNTSLEPNEIVVKFTGRPEQAPEVIAFLRANVEGFEKCDTSLTKFVASHRAGRMIMGEYVLTGDDVLAGRKFEDAVARGAWPIEQWSSDGVARYKYLAAGEHYEIPARALRSRAIKNLFMAGKTLSADVDAIASARVMGCCLATGEAAGQFAARSLESRHP